MMRTSFWAGMAAMLLASMTLTATPATAQSQYWQCAPFARMISGIQLFGRAADWWAQAAGKYQRGQTPKVGSVLSFRAFRAMPAGHVATVSEVVDARTVKLTHANWSIINGRRGQVERDVTAVDVSEAGDWSKVRVWWGPSRGLGMTAYPTNGFIYAAAEAAKAMMATGAEMVKSDD
ncbi:MAG: CHAP domain-containing protein [Sphingomonas sp.]|nr:CHAP domain-containing protein [Sphingomonas sp.]MDX3885649.1 CHAP domain-containing protein [Sphingomonas sp.]